MNIRILIMLAGIVFAQVAPNSGKYTPLINHRGQWRDYPENTLESFQASTGPLANGFECDVWCTKSGDLMIMHDASLQKMCQQNISVSAISEADRSKYPIIGKDRNYMIPTLEECLQAARKNSSIILIHLKGKDAQSPDGIEKVVTLIRKYKYQKKSILFSGSKKTVNEINEYEDIQAGFTYSGGTNKAIKAINWATDNTIYNVCCLSSNVLDEKAVAYAHRNKIKIGPYKVGTWDEFIRIWRLDVDFIMKDIDL